MVDFRAVAGKVDKLKILSRYQKLRVPEINTLKMMLTCQKRLRSQCQQGPTKSGKIRKEKNK